MRIIIAGGRDFNDYQLLKTKLDEITHNDKDVIVVSGTARGADLLGERYAKEKGYEIKRYPADWDLGKHAGHLRNSQMADNADKCVVFWDGKSKGTKNMIEEANKRNLQTFIVEYETPVIEQISLEERLKRIRNKHKS